MLPAIFASIPAALAGTAGVAATAVAGISSTTWLVGGMVAGSAMQIGSAIYGAQQNGKITAETAKDQQSHSYRSAKITSATNWGSAIGAIRN